DHAAAGGLYGLAHRLAHLVRLAGGDPDASLPVAHRDERVEAEAPAALHDLRDAVDGNHVLDEPVALALPLARVAPLPTAPPTPTAPTPATPPPSAAASTPAPTPTTSSTTSTTSATSGTSATSATWSRSRVLVVPCVATRVRRLRRLNRPGA